MISCNPSPLFGSSLFFLPSCDIGNVSCPPLALLGGGVFLDSGYLPRTSYSKGNVPCREGMALLRTLAVDHVEALLVILAQAISKICISFPPQNLSKLYSMLGTVADISSSVWSVGTDFADSAYAIYSTTSHKRAKF